MKSGSTRYTLTAIGLHWINAALVFFLFPFGWYMVDLPPGPARGADFALHKSVGITVFTLVLVRLLWRVSHRPPPFPDIMPLWQRSVAGAVHKLFYVFLFLQPVSGYLSSSFSGHSTQYFGIPLPQWGHNDPPLNEFFTDIHVLSSIFFLCLIIAHVAGALSHLMKKGDYMVRRMLPWA